MMERASAATFAQPLTRTDALYFTVTVEQRTGTRSCVGHRTPPIPSVRAAIAPQCQPGWLMCLVGRRAR
jgi:hypothetical protein